MRFCKKNLHFFLKRLVKQNLFKEKAMKKTEELLKDGERLTFYECIQLLDKLAECDILMRDPNNKNNLITFRSADELNPEGFYTQAVIDVAQELYEDIEGQKFLIDELKTKDADFEFTPNCFLTNGGLHEKVKSHKQTAERE